MLNTLARLAMEIKVIDLERIKHAISQLADIDKDRAVRAGLGEAGTVFRTGGLKRLKSRLGTSTQETKKRAPGNLIKSLTKRVKKRKPGVLVGFASPIGNHAHLVDMGTKDRYTKKGKYSGKMPANRFFADTKSQDEGKAFQKLNEGIQRAITRIQNR